MAASTLRDLLSTTDSLFNKSDELNAELQRLVRAVQSRRAPAEAAEIVRLAAAGVDAASLQLLGAPAPGSSAASGAQQPTVLEKALADCRAASAAITSLHENRNAVVDARAEAIQREQELATASREQLLAELRAGSAATDEKYLAELRGIVASAGSAAAAPAAPATAAAPTEVAAAGEAAAAAPAAAE